MTAELPVGRSARLRVLAGCIGVIAFLTGIEGAAARDRERDFRRPRITITSPVTENTYLTAQATLSLTGTASRVVRVTWSNDAGGNGEANGTGNWSVAQVPLAVGLNNLTVTAYDSAGRQRSDSLAVVRSAPVAEQVVDPPAEPPADTTAPGAPSGLQAAAVSTSQINLAWAAASDNVAVTGYRLQRCQDAGCSSFRQIGTISGRYYSDAGLLSGTSYSYRVQAADAAGNLSDPSSTSTAATAAVYEPPVVSSPEPPVVSSPLPTSTGTHAPEGQTRFYAMHGAPWDKYDNSSGYAFYDENYARMYAFCNYWSGSKATAYQRTHCYKDSYAIYYGSALATQHPEWVLKDAAGNKLYIQWACNGSNCSQYAADIGNQAFRDWWIADLAAQLANGPHSGIWIDDVNMEWRISNGAGTQVLPVDPRTGTTMTLSNWRRYMAEFLEQVRTAFPTHEIAHNGLWYSSGNLTDPYIQRQILAADWFNLERGFTDGGITYGTGRYSFEAYLSFIDYVHSLGRGVIQMEYTTSTTLRDYALGAYLLTNAGTDLITTNQEFWAAPGYWWGGVDLNGIPQGWDTNLGATTSGRIPISGGYRRTFECGWVEVLGPPIKTAHIERTACAPQ